MKARCLALDLGGVLFDVDMQLYLDAATRAFGVAAQRLEQATFTSGYWAEAEVGALSADGFAQAVLDKLGLQPSAEELRQWQRCWGSVLSLRPGVLDVLRNWPGQLAIWSNTDPVHAMFLHQALQPISATWCLSCELGVEKPDAQFYLRALKKMSASPDQVHFVDDRADNVAAAQRLGIHAGQVHSLVELQAQLQNWQIPEGQF